MFAQMILSDNPSKDSIQGVVVKNNDGKVLYAVTSGRIFDDYGILGVCRAVKTSRGNPRLKDDMITASTDDNLTVKVKKLCKQHNLNIRMSAKALA